MSTSRPPVVPGATWSSASSAISPETVCAEASFTTSRNSPWPLESTSTNTTKAPSLSSGRPRPPISWRRSNAPARHWIIGNLLDALPLVSMPSTPFDASSAVRLHSSLSSTHDVITVTPFNHNVHHRGHWTVAAYGCLKPPPTGRLRRAHLHLSHSMTLFAF